MYGTLFIYILKFSHLYKYSFQQCEIRVKRRLVARLPIKVFRRVEALKLCKYNMFGRWVCFSFTAATLFLQTRLVTNYPISTADAPEFLFAWEGPRRRERRWDKFIARGCVKEREYEIGLFLPPLRYLALTYSRARHPWIDLEYVEVCSLVSNVSLFRVVSVSKEFLWKTKRFPRYIFTLTRIIASYYGDS